MKQFATVTVIGRDKTGVIARVTAFLFEQHANIEALEEHVTRGQFSMTLQASWRPADCNAAIVGVTAHFVSMRLDEGPIIAQGSFRIRPGMALKELVARGQQLEAGVLVKAVKLYLGKRLDVYWGVVKEV